MTYEVKHDIYQTITDKVIADLERGVRPWHRRAVQRYLTPLNCNRFSMPASAAR